jgi:hypothetical protein
LFGRKELVRGWGTVAQLGSGPSARVSISVAGLEPYEVAFDRGDLKGRWPSVGTVLPVEVDLKKPTKVHIVWDEVGELPTQPTAPTQPQASAFGSGYGAQPVPGLAAPGVFTANHVQVVGADPNDPRVAEALRMAEGVMGIDMDGDGQVAPPQPGQEQAAQAFQRFGQTPGATSFVTGAAVPGQAAPSAAGSRVDRLAQLAQLHQQGSITEAEFAQLKADLLAEP